MLGEDLCGLLCVGTSLLSLEWEFPPRPLLHHLGQHPLESLGRDARRQHTPANRRKTKECLVICLLIFVRVPKEKKESKESR